MGQITWQFMMSSGFFKNGWIAAFFMLVALGFASTKASALSRVDSFFNSTEIFKSDLKPFPKWLGVLDRHFAESAGAEAACGSDRECPYRKWLTFIDSIRTEPPAMQIQAINRFVNKHKYIVDPINWGLKDYWATPKEFFSKNGDCEDFGIVKYLSLRALGWEADKLRIVVLQDLNLQTAHAVLVVRHEGQDMVLDNQLRIAVEASRIKHYLPIYSVSEAGWWRHFAKR